MYVTHRDRRADFKFSTKTIWRGDNRRKISIQSSTGGGGKDVDGANDRNGGQSCKGNNIAPAASLSCRGTRDFPNRPPLVTKTIIRYE